MKPAAQPGKRPRAKRKPRRKQECFRRIVGVIPPAMRTIIVVILAAGLFLLANFVYHVIHKPTEMLYPVSGVLKKSPAETWREYGPLFREYSTAAISAELLAALAQTEGAGDPIAHTYWRWRLAWPPFDMYKPASSAVGMYQMTDGTFADSQAYCIRNHMVLERGSACPSEEFQSRLVPSHSIELTAAHLDRSVAAILGRQSKATTTQKNELAALIHLCGARVARDFVRQGFKLMPDEKCGDHSAKVYVERVEMMIQQFIALRGMDRPASHPP